MGFLDGLMGGKHPPMLGLDISSSSVKLVELSQNKAGEFVLERFASEVFEKGWIADGHIETLSKGEVGLRLAAMNSRFNDPSQSNKP